ncbi:MAG TPA: hypothetical protein DDX99_08195 [Desulfofustis sp.]|nr:hypothetical protein [Desulfofustis sp.]HBH31290.1 hypothetical protein [Desulfofustis sp.]
MSHDYLKSRHRQERAHFSKYLDIRIHRALSWLHRAEACVDDPDASFIFLWIAFNAAYANEMPAEYSSTEQQRFNEFIKRLLQLDENRRLHDLVWNEFTQSIRVLLDNKYVFQPFWDYANNKLTEQEWIEKFIIARKTAAHALGKGNSSTVLAVVLSRLYTLRNQLVHGGATWKSSINREQVRDCNRLIGCLVPAIIEIMMDNPDELWGQPCYPVI